MTERSLHILIVDDDRDNAASLGELFELCGHTIRVVHSGEAAIAAYRADEFDIAFMDVVMDGKNGVDSFLEIKRSHPDAKVIMMTGYSVEQLLQEAVSNGALGVMTKPVEANEALQLLASLGPEGMVVAQAIGATSRAALQFSLEQAGKRCRLMDHSDETLAAGMQDDEVLLIDINKPLIDGVGLYASLKRNGFRSQAIIFAEKGSGKAVSDDFLKDYRITGILSKPFDPSLLIESVVDMAA
jgi:two-component system, NtrC family, response regulator HydG